MSKFVKVYNNQSAAKMANMTFETVATIRTGFADKFGIPRQSGIVNSLRGKIIFEKKYRDANAIKGLENTTHIWILWEFSMNKREKWSPMVRPPRLGGNSKMGVFATRSPFRPNPIGLSAVKLDKIDYTDKLGPVLYVSGADLMDGTPIYDIKPYIPYADSIPEAENSVFGNQDNTTDVVFECDGNSIDQYTLNTLAEILKQDPTPAYTKDSDKTFSFEYENVHVEFTKTDGKIIVRNIELI